MQWILASCAKAISSISVCWCYCCAPHDAHLLRKQQQYLQIDTRANNIIIIIYSSEISSKMNVNVSLRNSKYGRCSSQQTKLLFCCKKIQQDENAKRENKCVLVRFCYCHILFYLINLTNNFFLIYVVHNIFSFTKKWRMFAEKL